MSNPSVPVAFKLDARAVGKSPLDAVEPKTQACGPFVDRLRLSAEELSPRIDAASLGFTATSELEPLDTPIGQERAIEALEFGLGIKSDGFNVFVSGALGTGRSSLALETIKRLAAAAPTPPDRCFVNNFQDAAKPTCLSFPPGDGRRFKQEMAALVESLQRDIPNLFESKSYLDEKAKIAEEADNKKKTSFEELARAGLEHRIGFQQTPAGLALLPLKDGQPMDDAEFAALPEDEKRSLVEGRKAIEREMREFYVRIHALDRDAQERLVQLDRDVVTHAMIGRFEALRRSIEGSPAVAAHLEQVHADIVKNYRDFMPHQGPPLPFPGLEPKADLTRYDVNVIVEHRAGEGAPVIEEPHPTYTNLIGRIERRGQLGFMYTDFTQVRAGSVLQAHGGFLLLNALDVLRQPFSWDALKRVIRTREVKVEEQAEFFGFASGVRPQPIPVDVKFVLIGPPIVFHLLQAHDEDFSQAFKVRAEFDTDIAFDENRARAYARFVSRLCRDEGLPPFAVDAVAAVITQAFRMADRNDRLSLRFRAIGDLIRETAHWARHRGAAVATRADVEKALAQKRRRSNLAEEAIQDEIADGTLIVDLEGEVVGQVNGLSVHQLGDYSFGRPCRITARTFAGTKGVIDIQREAELAGSIHSKAVMTLAGFLNGKFGAALPLALNASLTFEQTYAEVEGDSATVAELAASLSSLADVPVRQSLAVTGSANQLGEVQPVGGVNEKIEGFFESCSKHGVRGHGVIIPVRNKKHLALRSEVVDAVRDGRFAVYAVDTVDQALELLTGVPAGERGPDGNYPPESLYGRAARRLDEMMKALAALKPPEPNRAAVSGSNGQERPLLAVGNDSSSSR